MTDATTTRLSYRLRTALTWLMCTVGPALALAMIDHLAPPGVAWDDPGNWLEATPPEEALIALAAVAVRLAAVWVLASTTVTGLAMLSGHSRVTGAASRFALPAVRRLAVAAATRMAAVTLAVTPVLAPVTASALAATPQSSVTAWAGDEPDQPLPPFLVIAPGGGELPAAVDEAGATAEEQATTDTRPVPIPPFILTEGGTVAPVDTASVSGAIGATSYTVAAGDHLWAIAGKRLTEVRGKTPDEGEHARYWVRLVDANRGRIRSGDPDLIFPGEVIELPEVEPASG